MELKKEVENDTRLEQQPQTKKKPLEKEPDQSLAAIKHQDNERGPLKHLQELKDMELVQPEDPVQVLVRFCFQPGDWCTSSTRDTKPNKNLNGCQVKLLDPPVDQVGSKDYEKRKQQLLKRQEQELKELHKEMVEIEKMNTSKEQRLRVREANEVMKQELVRSHEQQLKELGQIIQKLKDAEHQEKLKQKRDPKSLKDQEAVKDIEEALKIQSDQIGPEKQPEANKAEAEPKQLELDLKKKHLKELQELDVLLKEIEQGQDQSMRLYLNFDLKKRRVERRQQQELEQLKQQLEQNGQVKPKVTFSLPHEEIQVKEQPLEQEVAPTPPLRKKKLLRFQNVVLEHKAVKQPQEPQATHDVDDVDDDTTCESESSASFVCYKDAELQERQKLQNDWNKEEERKKQQLALEHETEQKRKMKQVYQQKLLELKQRQEQLEQLEQQNQKELKLKKLVREIQLEKQREALHRQLQQELEHDTDDDQSGTGTSSSSSASSTSSASSVPSSWSEEAAHSATSLTINVIGNTNEKRRNRWSLKSARTTSSLL